VSIVEDTRTHLLTQSDVTDLVGTRIYYDNLPQNASIPALVIEMSDDEPAARHLTGSGTLHRAGVGIFAYADTHPTVASVGEAVLASIEYASGTWGDSTVHRAFVENVQDATDAPKDGGHVFRRVRGLLCTVWYEYPEILSSVLSEGGDAVLLESEDGDLVF